MKKSDVIIGIASRAPALAGAALWLWAQSHRLFKVSPEVYDHWLVEQLVRHLQRRVPVYTRLRNGMKVKVHLGDHVGGAIIRSGYYEPRTIRLIELLLKPGMTFLDIGTHVGQYTLVASRLVGSSGSVHGFEPDPETFRWLLSNIRRNGLTNVRSRNVALAAEPGRLVLYLSSVSDIGSNSLREPPSFSGRACEVETINLDAYLRASGIGRVDFVKIDVEGAEYGVLMGASDLLRRPDRPVMIIEFEEARQRAFDRSCAQLADLLKDFGYDLFRLDSANLDPYDPEQNDAPSVNVLAVPANRRDLVVHLRNSLD
jgi:FkbM family methyltransferase